MTDWKFLEMLAARIVRLKIDQTLESYRLYLQTLP